MEISGNALKIYKQDLSKVACFYLGELYEKIWSNAMQNSKNEQEIVQAMCFFQDVMEHGSQEHFNQIYPMFIKNSLNFKTKNSDIIQNIVNGFSLIAERLDSSTYLSLHETFFNVIFY